MGSDWDVLRGDISNLLLALSATSKRSLVISRRHFPRSLRAERVPVYGISVARASPFWSGQADREGQVLEEEQVRREPALRFPLEGVYRPGTDGAPADGSKMAAQR
jgi:hypothetical protein